VRDLVIHFLAEFRRRRNGFGRGPQQCLAGLTPGAQPASLARNVSDRQAEPGARELQQLKGNAVDDVSCLPSGGGLETVERRAFLYFSVYYRISRAFASYISLGTMLAPPIIRPRFFHA
jgi:hypothetical protein